LRLAVVAGNHTLAKNLYSYPRYVVETLRCRAERSGGDGAWGLTGQRLSGKSPYGTAEQHRHTWFQEINSIYHRIKKGPFACPGITPCPRIYLACPRSGIGAVREPPLRINGMRINGMKLREGEGRFNQDVIGAFHHNERGTGSGTPLQNHHGTAQ